MRKEELEKFFNVNIEQLAEILGHRTALCPLIKTECNYIDCPPCTCTPFHNKECWLKYFKENLEA
jgi:hypothetical protein